MQNGESPVHIQWGGDRVSDEGMPVRFNAVEGFGGEGGWGKDAGRDE